MSTETGFKPVFGPNGAVMNAPSMTPEMLEKIRQSEKPPKRSDVFRELRLFGFFGVMAAAVWLRGDVIRKALLSSPWWSGAATGAVVTISAVVLWFSLGRTLARWELRPSQLKQRRLEMPEWSRWLLAGADSVVAAGYAITIATFLVDVQREHLLVVISATCAMIAAAILGLGVRWSAGRRGWVWRVNGY